jgi:hypothetical protein
MPYAQTMRIHASLLAVVTGLLVTGCASNRNHLTLDTVGPSGQLTGADAATGTLVVYSAFKRNADFDSRDPYRQEYSDYKILTDNGHLLHKVHNNSGTIFQDVVSVSLSPGKYQVEARANGYGFVTVPVVVEAQHSTVLHLEGGSPWPDTSAFNQSNTVRLPDGQIVGYRAASN